MTDLFSEDKELVKDWKPLYHSFIPPELVDREKEQNDLAKPLSCAKDGVAPPHIMVMGLNGVGKTVTVQFVLNQLKHKLSERGVDYSYIYTNADNTPYQVVTQIAQNMGLKIPKKGLSFAYVWDELKQEFDKRPVNIIVLDEIDKMIEREGEKLLYHFSRHPHVCTIGIAVSLNTPNMIKRSDVKSSYTRGLEKISFKPYRVNDLHQLLVDRVKRSLYDGVIQDIPSEEGGFSGSLNYIAADAVKNNRGDARYAIDLLRTAVKIVSERGGDYVTNDDVRQAIARLEREFYDSSIKELHLDHQIMLESLIKIELKNDELPTLSSVYKLFDRNQKKPLGRTKKREIVNDLEAYGFVQTSKEGKKTGERGVDWFIKSTIESDKERKRILTLIDEVAAEYEVFYDL